MGCPMTLSILSINFSLTETYVFSILIGSSILMFFFLIKRLLTKDVFNACLSPFSNNESCSFSLIKASTNSLKLLITE